MSHPSLRIGLADSTLEFDMLHDDEVIPKYAANIVIGRVKGQEVTLEI